MNVHLLSVIAAGLLLATNISALPPAIIQQNATIGTVLKTQYQDLQLCCNKGTLKLKDSADNSASPWKYFRVRINGSCSELALNKTIGNTSSNSSCWPEKPWKKTGNYSCGSIKEQTLLVVLNVTDNEYPPTFCDQNCTSIQSKVINVEENKTKSSVVASIQLCDKDSFQDSSSTISLHVNDKVVDTVSKGDNHHYDIVLREALNYEERNTYNVNLTVSDGKNTSSMVLTINVKDVDDLPPAFEKKVYYCKKAEGEYKTQTSTACQVTAKDQDKGVNSSINYSVINTDTGSASFSVDANGIISVNGSLDRENLSTYVIPVKAFQTDRPGDRFDVAPVVLTVTDVDDNLPIFNTNHSQISIMENTPNGTLVFQFTAQDQDEGENAEFTYSLTRGNEAFHIDSDGKLTVKDSTKLDRESSQSLSVIVQARPHNMKSGYFNNASLTISLTDENDNSPRFNRTVYNVTINKTTSINKGILVVAASDPDNDKNGQVVYSIIDNDGTLSLPFKLNQTSGSIQLHTSLRDHFQPFYSFDIKAEDQALEIDRRRIGLTSVKVNIRDENVHDPKIALLESFNITEGAPIGTAVAWLNITDMDSQDKLKVGLKSGTAMGQFKIKKAYSTVYRIETNASLDRETEDVYNLTVTCDDGIGNHSQTRKVHIYIMDENDNAPIFTNHTYNFTVTENNKSVVAGTITATDKDIGINSQIVYKIDADSPWNKNFTINPISGRIKVISFLDREVLEDQSMLSFRVFAVDKGNNPRTGTTSVTITVADVNDNPPVFEHANATFTINELDSPKVINTAKATDKDLSPYNIIQYQLEDIRPPALSSYLNISTTTGVFMTRKAIPIEKSDNGSITLKIIAENTQAPIQQGIQNIVLHIKDVNNHSPEFKKKQYNFTINETSEPETTIGRVKAIDADLEPEFNTVTYWIEQPNVPFTVNLRSGDIVLSRPIDYDSPANQHSFEFKVYATDLQQLANTSSHTNSTSVSITVTNCNDNRPQFTKDVYICKLQEDSTQTKGCNIQASDIDKLAELKYTVAGDNRFKHVRSGELATTNIDYDDPHSHKQYKLNVSVTDGNYTSFATVYIDLENINDNKPKFTQSNYIITVPENVNLSDIGRVTATDGDGDMLIYGMTGNCTEVHMSADGYLSLKNKPFDYEKIQLCSFTASVNDTKYVAQSSITIKITDENDNKPNFKNTPYNKTVKENVNVTSTILKVQASDADGTSQNSKISYTFVSGNIGYVFSLDKNTGTIKTSGTLDASKQSLYTLVVEAKDGGHPALSNYVEVTIHVEDVNNHHPKFLHTPYNVEVTENQPTHQLLQIFAEDADPTDVLKISVKKPGPIFTNLFSVNKTMLYVKELDTEKLKRSKLLVEIEVTDGLNTEIAAVSVTVHDVNDNTPYFVNTPTNKDLNDTIPKGSTVLQVQAKDEDFSEANSKLLFYLYNGEGYFDINRTSGKIRLLRPLDDIHREPFNLNILVTDCGSPPNTNQTSIKFSVIVTNKNAPRFINISSKENRYDIEFKEDKSDQTANFTAEDDDKGEAGRLSYSIDTIADNWQTKFNFDNRTGVLTLKTPVNYEDTDQHQYSFVVTARDHAQFPKSSTAAVLVHIVDVDEAPTLVLPTQTVYKELNAPAESIISRVTVNDPDKAVRYRNFTYSVSDGSLDLEVKAGTHDDEGILRTRKPLSQAGKYTINITVTDGGGLNDTRKLTIDVSNITGSDLNVTIFENKKPPVHLINLYAATSTNKSIAFEMTNSSSTDNFQILSNGSFIAVKPLDREVTPTFYVEIKGYEQLGGKNILKAQIQMHVTVMDVNDNIPVFNQSVYNIEVKESHQVNTAITKVTATDKDENNVLTYSISQPDGTFRIDTKSGVIILQQPLNYDAQKSYNLTVICSDTMNHGRTNVLIQVLDVNNHVPKFTQTSFTFELNESQTLGPIGHKVTATDPDTGDKGQLRYNVLPPDGPLSIDSQGQLSLQHTLDFDVMRMNTTVIMKVQVKDTANHTSTCTLILTILDTNDNAPVFSQHPYIFNVTEGKTVSSSIYSVEATDKDSGMNGNVTFSINGTNSQYFQIIPQNNKGIIHIVKPLDRESDTVPHDNTSAAIYTLTVMAMDHGNPPQTSSVNVHFHVDDVNDCPPKFSSSNYSESVQEGTAIGTKISSVTTTDCDSNPSYKTVIYSLSGASNDFFNITSQGDVILAKKVSIKQQKFILEVTATDGQNSALSAKVNMTVIVLDANDNSPNFTKPQYTFSVSESLKSGVSVGMVTAVDDDQGENGNVSYTITSGNTNNTFIISKLNGYGLIKTKTTLDREQISQYSLIITAHDNAKTGRRQGTCTVVVKVTDINDNYPVFGSQTGYTGTVFEDAIQGSLVHVIPPITAIDQDNGINGTEGIKFSLLPIDSPFFINQSTSSIQVCGNLDREAKEVLTLHVVATDYDGKGLKSNASLNITVEDINDEAPTFNNTSYTFSISENVNPNTVIGNVTVTDNDKDGLQKVRLHILTGGHENFYIESKLSDDKLKLVGTIYVIGNLDREDKDVYNMTIEASDTMQSSTTTVRVEIMDENDNSPVFNETQVDISVVENSSAGIIYNMAAYDGDKPGTNNSIVIFYLDNQTVSENGSKFGIYPNGSLFTKTTLDREEQESYTLTVVASDQGKQPHITSLPVTVTVLDINDNAPKFCNETACKIHSFVVETAPVFSIIALPVAADQDKGSNGTVIYSIVDSPAKEYFHIENKTGLVTIAKPIVINTLIGKKIVSKSVNSTSTVTLNMSVEAQDRGPNGGLTSYLTLLVTVEPINEKAPEFRDKCDFNITEQLPVGTLVGSCVAVIPNETFSHMTYRLIAGFDSDTFQINSQNGTITTKTLLDRELMSHYSLSVQVTDGRTPERTAFSAVTITVRDINDNAPEFYQNSISLMIPENTNWTKVINASAFDRDAGENGAILYTFDNSYNGKFLLNSITGMLTVNGTFDRETNAECLFHIKATDQGNPPKSSSVEVKVIVTDMNDNAPEFQNIVSPISVPENQRGQVFSIRATDGDFGENGTVIYRLSNTDGGPFRIDPQEGKVFLDGALDYENKSLYHLQLTASDLGQPPKQTELNVTINVTDVYDFVPMFRNITYNIYISASTPVGTKIAAIHVEEGTAQYSLSGSDSGLFHIEPNTGDVTIKSILDARNRLYVATVTAIDQLNQTTECTLIAHIIGHEILFENKTFTTSLPENLSTRQLLLDFNTTEEWTGHHVIYSIQKVEPEVSDVFDIESSTGKLYCAKSLDRETYEVYNIYITANLASTSNRQRRAIDDSASIAKLTVHVIDVDDNLPYFPASQQTLFGVPSDAGEGYLVTQLKAIDLDAGDNGRVYYEAGGDTDVFGIDNNSGSIKTLIPIASKRKKTFHLNVTAMDKDGQQKASINVQILLVPRSDQLMMIVNKPLSQFQKNQNSLIRNISDILGVEVQLEKIESHRSNNGDVTQLELTKSDMYFHGINKTSGTIVPYSQMMTLINQAQAQLEKLFNTKTYEVIHVKKLYTDPSAITVPVICLIVIALLIFLGSTVGIIVTLVSWSRLNHDMEMMKKHQESKLKPQQTYEMDTLRSHRSGEIAMQPRAEALNPAYMETELVTKQNKKRVEYEAKEMCMNFGDEPLRFTDEVLTSNGTRSVADSALENTSLNSNDQQRTGSASSSATGQPAKKEPDIGLTVDEGPVMTSSPRISMDIDADRRGPLIGQSRPTLSGIPVADEDSKQSLVRANSKVLTFMMDSGETETDADAIDELYSKVQGKTTFKSGDGQSEKDDADIGALYSQVQKKASPSKNHKEAEKHVAEDEKNELYSQVNKQDTSLAVGLEGTASQIYDSIPDETESKQGGRENEIEITSF